MDKTSNYKVCTALFANLWRFGSFLNLESIYVMSP